MKPRGLTTACFTAICLLIPVISSAQFIKSKPLQAFFTAPDTVCVGMPVNIVNASTASTYSWVFATASSNNVPLGQNFQNPGYKLRRPKFITLIKDSGIYYTFITSAGNRSIIRTIYGSSLMNPPVTSFPVFISGIPSDKMRGIQIKLDSVNNVWVGFFSSGNALTRMIFSGGLSKTPTIVDIPFPGVAASSGLIIVKEGMRWFGFACDSLNNTITRLRFDSSLLKMPVVEQLGNLGNLNGPTGLCHTTENGNHYIFVCNSGSSTLSRIDFGASLRLQPSGTNLGNTRGLLNGNTGISIISDCMHTTALVCNNGSTSSGLVTLNFGRGITGPADADTISSGSPFNPYGISELMRVKDTIFCFYVNDGNSTLAQLHFSPASVALPPTSILPQPGPVIYTDSGNYNIMLRTDEGLPQESFYCKPIIVLPELKVNLGGDRTICQGKSALLDAGPGFASYLWSTGASTQTILASDSMQYWVKVTNSPGCIASDTIWVHRTRAPEHTVDTTICFGEKYWAGGKYQTQSGHYTDTLTLPSGCDSILFTNLSVKPEIRVHIGNDTVLCPGDSYILDATTPGATSYLWQDGSTLPTYTATQPGLFWAHVGIDGCIAGDSVYIEACPYKLTFPTAFTPNNDGVNDVFQAVGISVINFHMEIFDRWGVIMFSTDDITTGWNGTWKNANCPAGVYVYEVTFEAASDPCTTLKSKGTFTLIR
jgi:gliding motility-associated-like protein